MKFDTKEYYKNKILGYNFITNRCNNIDIELLKIAETLLTDRYDIIKLFYILLKQYDIAITIEKSILEFSLSYVSSNNLEHTHIYNVYNDQVSNIYENLDQNSYLKNKQLLNNLLTGTVKPEYIAFLTPQQLFPEKWEGILQKKRIKEDVENNIGITDIYKCNRCGERKCRISELQIRSADEPINKFITCTVCYKTFII